MSQLKKIDKILEIASTQELQEYHQLVKVLKKKLPLFGGTARIAAAALKEYLGDISRLEISTDMLKKSETGKIIFEDIKDGRARLFINIGKNHNVSTGDLIREIVKRSGVDGKSIGKIDIHSTYSFFEVPEQFAEMVYHSFDDARIKGVPVVVEPAKKRSKESK
ncbi:MAG TPA: DbpA RNA binding domain-containing protein [Spirochaetota bacterium]|nr:DbpA RNA binding domain-containing protein [Spirochaetota bacterium]HRZ27484.1 DbpA RNA binding domain-containing protein [Spirochaetota bacterium]HSA14210.1 DbpA RNA binding domain-containing protein [Spirochaetota bacterium]